MIVNLPKQLRPINVRYKKCALGVDLPAAFIYDLWAIDKNLFPFWFQYRTLWEQVIQNDYYGKEEDPRYTINYDYGELNYGAVLTDGEGKPIEEGAWHIIEYRWPHGYGHVCKLESTDREYLHLFLQRLYMQAKWNDKYGRLGRNSYQKYLDQLDEEKRVRHTEERKEMMDAVHKENQWLVDKAMDNFKRGKVAATNPMKETITTFSGQRNKSRIVRPLQDEDKESGIILPN